ncbi:MAG: bifunctional diaminohydroxyphosphoribosylaminopyrimidine deaminase/5-amino-6-(5-phosphoribosylamino)uracil reductase RibD [Aquificaceae bacterium]|nr:MAG: bifunctional diaminohydroxyphosphoribosylaminopyrimidine deaminase/5-amino-6-(5-phosphoribosylamino)uracil reductase RibD [Aquificaceae bacterium]
MARAIELARKGLYTTHPNPRVGCVIVKNDKIIGEGYHQRTGQPHAEVLALQDASEDAKGATAYVTLEPCSHTGRTPPCADGLLDAGISHVVVAMQDPNPLVAGKGIKKLRDAGVDVLVGVLEQQAQQLNQGFIKRMQQGLPWVRVKMAMSLDGRTAMASGESQWITAPDARTDVQKYRASADAILTGQGTLLADDPSLNVRLNTDDLEIEGAVRQPVRVVLDEDLKISPAAKMLSLEGETWVYTLSDDDNKKQLLAAANANIIKNKANADGYLQLVSVLKDLAKREINEVHVEAGQTLTGALLQEGLVDELIIYMAPTLMGSDARGLFNLPALVTMQDRIHLEIKDIRAIGRDWRIIANPSENTTN